MGKCKLLVDKGEVARRFSTWAKSPEGQERIRKDAEKANQFIEDFRSYHNVSVETWNRRITI